MSQAIVEAPKVVLINAKKTPNQPKLIGRFYHSIRFTEWTYLGIHIPSKSDTSQYGDICALLTNSPSRLRGQFLQARVA